MNYTFKRIPAFPDAFLRNHEDHLQVNSSGPEDLSVYLWDSEMSNHIDIVARIGCKIDTKIRKEHPPLLTDFFNDWNEDMDSSDEESDQVEDESDQVDEEMDSLKEEATLICNTMDEYFDYLDKL